MADGRIYRKGSKWVVDCAAHVRARIKRYFARAARASVDAVRLEHSKEVCRDLHWFRSRFDFEISPEDAAYLERCAEEHRRLGEDIARINSGDYVAPEFPLAIPPRAYQAVAADLALKTRGLLVGDSVGLGKTATSICMLTRPETLPALVVTLTHLPRQWAAEVHRFIPGLRVHIINKGQPYDIAKAMSRRSPLEAMMSGESAGADVLIINYHKLSGWADALAGQVKTVIFDEIQELRRTESNKYAAAKAIADKAEFRIGLSATPIFNYGDEIHSVTDALRPGALGTRSEFLREWCGEAVGKHNVVRDPRALGTYLRAEGIMIRRTREEVGRELPDLIDSVIEVDSNPAALEAVKGSAVELARLILSDSTMEKGQRFLAAGELDYMLRQATGIAKAPYVAQFIRMVVDGGEKVLLYGWHHAVYDVWMSMLSEFGAVLYTGKQTIPQKEEAKRRFLEDDRCRVLAMSLRAGAGLDGLQSVCRTVVHGELDWSPMVHKQATGRVYRDGQQGKVLSYFMLSDSGSDPIVADVLGLKRAQATGIIDPDAEILQQRVDLDSVKNMARACLAQYG